MKRTIILFLLALVCVCAHAQDCFSVKDGHIIWQEIYETDLDSASIVNALQATGKLADLVNTPSGLACTMVPHTADYQGAGFSTMQAAIVLTTSEMTSHALVQFREGRYRVTLDDITFRVRGVPGFSSGETTMRIEDYLDRKGNIKNSFRTYHVGEILDYDFNRIFELREAEDEKW